MTPFKSIAYTATFAATLLIAGIATTQAQNLLVDPGFESDGSALGDWNLFNGALFSSTVARTGTFSMENPGNGGFGVPGSYETFAATAGLEYDLTGYGYTATAPGAGTTFGALQITFFSGVNGTGNNLGSIDVSTGGTATGAGNAQTSNEINASSPTGSWISLDTGIAEAPVGAESMQVFTIVVDQNPATVYFDDLSLQVVPEPSVMALAGTAFGATLCFIRRKKI